MSFNTVLAFSPNILSIIIICILPSIHLLVWKCIYSCDLQKERLFLLLVGLSALNVETRTICIGQICEIVS